MKIQLTEYPAFFSKKENKTIFCKTKKWSGKKGTIEGSIKGFFLQLKKDLKSRGIKKYTIYLYDIEKCRDCDFENSLGDNNFYMIRYAIEKV